MELPIVILIVVLVLSNCVTWYIVEKSHAKIYIKIGNAVYTISTGVDDVVIAIENSIKEHEYVDLSNIEGPLDTLKFYSRSIRNAFKEK